MDAHPGDGVFPDVDNEPMVHMLIGLREVVQQRPGCSLGQQADETVPARCQPKSSTGVTDLNGHALPPDVQRQHSHHLFPSRSGVSSGDLLCAGLPFLLVLFS